MNVENILKVADAIEQHSIPDLGFNMGTWRGSSYGDNDLSGHNCGTVACIGGWAMELFDLPFPDMGGAAEALGLDKAEAEQLFFPGEMFWKERGAFPYEARPAQAAAVLRHLAATGEVDWSVPALAKHEAL